MVTVMDTASDFRILVAEDALTKLENLINSKRLPIAYEKKKAQERIHRIKSNLMAIKYSYLSPEQLVSSQIFSEYERSVSELISLLNLDTKSPMKKDNTQKFAIAQYKYVIRILTGLKSRILLGQDNKPEYAIDIVGVKVLTTAKHPQSNKLKVCKVADLEHSYVIITNMEKISKNFSIGVAFLPPVILMGEISEGMFCTDKIENGLIGKRIPSNLITSKELFAEIGKMLKKK
mgnify:CR=1 FL=1